MFRTGQMMLAEGIKRHFSKNNIIENNKKSRVFFETIIRLFLDNLKAPFSIHNFYSVAHEFNYFPGDWLNVSAVFNSFEILNKIKNFSIVVFNDGCIFLDQIYSKTLKLCEICQNKIYPEGLFILNFEIHI